MSQIPSYVVTVFVLHKRVQFDGCKARSLPNRVCCNKKMLLVSLCVVSSRDSKSACGTQSSSQVQLRVGAALRPVFFQGCAVFRRSQLNCTPRTVGGLARSQAASPCWRPPQGEVHRSLSTLQSCEGRSSVPVWRSNSQMMAFFLHISMLSWWSE